MNTEFSLKTERFSIIYISLSKKIKFHFFTNSIMGFLWIASFQVQRMRCIYFKMAARLGGRAARCIFCVSSSFIQPAVHRSKYHTLINSSSYLGKNIFCRKIKKGHFTIRCFSWIFSCAHGLAA